MFRTVRKTVTIIAACICIIIGVPLTVALVLFGVDSNFQTNATGATIYFLVDDVNWSLVGGIVALLVIACVFGSIYALPKAGEDPDEAAARASHELTQRL